MNCRNTNMLSTMWRTPTENLRHSCQSQSRATTALACTSTCRFSKEASLYLPEINTQTSLMKPLLHRWNFAACKSSERVYQPSNKQLQTLRSLALKPLSCALILHGTGRAVFGSRGLNLQMQSALKHVFLIQLQTHTCASQPY